LAEGTVVAGIVHEFPERNMDGADNGVAEGAVGDELDLKRQTILLGQRFVDGEFHGVVPRGVAAGVFVDVGGGALRVERVAGERNDGVYVHLGEEVNVLDVLCGYDVEF